MTTSETRLVWHVKSGVKFDGSACEKTDELYITNHKIEAKITRTDNETLCKTDQSVRLSGSGNAETSRGQWTIGASDAEHQRGTLTQNAGFNTVLSDVGLGETAKITYTLFNAIKSVPQTGTPSGYKECSDEETIEITNEGFEANAGGDKVVTPCSDTYMMTAVLPSSVGGRDYTGVWTYPNTASAVIEASDLSNKNAVVTNLDNTKTTTFTWTVTSPGGCVSSDDIEVVNNNPKTS